MATLEKIRNKSVLLFVIIIVALLAFILGDFLNSGRSYFGHPSTVAKAGDATVEYQEYQTRLTQAADQYRQQGREVSNDMLSQQVINAILTEQLFNNEYDKLGIKVTDKELTEALTGENIHPMAYQTIAGIAQQLGLPEVSGRAVFDAVQNPTKYGVPAQYGPELRAMWAQQEKNLEEAMKQQKLMHLITGLYTFNKLDAKSFYDDNATTKTVSYVSKDAATVADDEIEFSDKDVEKFWKNQKQNFRIDEPTTEIAYIYVPVEPSQADRLAGEKAVEAALVALNSTPGTNGIASDSHFSAMTQKVTANAIKDATLRNFATSAATDSAALIARNGDSYTIAKLLGSSVGIDSLNISVLRVAPTANIDSMLAKAKATSAFASLDNDKAQGQDSLWITMSQISDPKLKDALTNNAVGVAFAFGDSLQAQNGSSIFRINKRHNPVRFYDLAVIDYTVDPSQETLSKLSGDLRTYISNNSSADEFAKNAGEAGYAVLTDQVSASSTGIGNVSDSRRFVKWAVENGKGKVSPVVQDDRQSYLMAVAVVDKYKNYIPYTSAAVNTMLTAQARNDKKAQKLVDQYAGKASDLNGYAKLMGTEVAQGTVNITSPALLNLGVGESALQGAIAAAEKGKLVGPLKGNRGVLVFVVDEVSTEARPFDETDYGSRFAQTFGIARQYTPLPLLLGKEKIDNRSLNFVQNVGE